MLGAVGPAELGLVEARYPSFRPMLSDAALGLCANGQGRLITYLNR